MLRVERKVQLIEFPIVVDNGTEWIIKKGVRSENFVRNCECPSDQNPTPECGEWISTNLINGADYFEMYHHYVDFTVKKNTQDIISACPLISAPSAYNPDSPSNLLDYTIEALCVTDVIPKKTYAGDGYIGDLFLYTIEIANNHRYDPKEGANSKRPLSYKVLVDEKKLFECEPIDCSLTGHRLCIKDNDEDPYQIGAGHCCDMQYLGHEVHDNYINDHSTIWCRVMNGVNDHSIVGYYHDGIFYKLKSFSTSSSTLFGELIPGNGKLINDSNDGEHSVRVTGNHVILCYKDTLHVEQNKAFLNGEIVCDGTLAKDKDAWGILSDDYSPGWKRGVVKLFPDIIRIETINVSVLLETRGAYTVTFR